MADAKKPLLADRFMATSASHDQLVPRRVAERVRARVRAARAFVLDDAAADRYADVVRDIPELVVRQHEFARAPYDTCWFEFDLRRFYERVTGQAADGKADHTVGYLVDHGVVHVVTGGTVEDPNAAPHVLPVRYHLHEPWSADEQMAFQRRAGVSGMHLDTFFWGESVIHLDRETRRGLREHHSCEIIAKPEIGADGMFASMFNGAAGDMRNVVALLLLMNRPSLTSFVRSVPSARGFVKGKLRPFMSHTVITIPLDPKPVLLRLGTPDDDATPRRRHEVRGHFARDRNFKRGTAMLCDHALELDPTSRNPDMSYRCALCGGKRWWVPAHGRGDAGVGFVDKRYLVTG